MLPYIFNKIIFIIITSLLLRAPLQSFAVKNKIECFKEFTISLYSFGFFYSSESNKGIDKDIADELQKRSKCKFVYLDMPRIRVLKSIENGSLDFTMSSIQTPEREKYAYFAHYDHTKNYVILRVETKANSWESFMANKNFKIGVVRGYSHGVSDNMIHLLQKEDRVLDFVDQEHLYAALKNDTVQAILGLAPVYKFHLLRTKNLAKKVVVNDWNPQEKSVNNGLMMSKNNFSKEEAEKWRSLMNEMIADGTVMKIFRKYLPVKEAKAISLN